MTKRQALDYFKRRRNMLLDDIPQQAENMAIEALEQEPCKDAISRQAVINLIRGCNSALEEPRIFESHHSGNIFEHYITELPPVNPQPKTGHWIKCIVRGSEEWGYKCSECNFCKYEKTINLSKFKFCPNCGAKMIEPQESEDKE